MTSKNNIMAVSKGPTMFLCFDTNATNARRINKRLNSSLMGNIKHLKIFILQRKLYRIIKSIECNMTYLLQPSNN